MATISMTQTARDFHTNPIHSTEFHVLAKWHNSLQGKASLFEFDLAAITNDQSLEFKITTKRVALTSIETQLERRMTLEAMNRRTAAQTAELTAMPSTEALTASLDSGESRLDKMIEQKGKLHKAAGKLYDWIKDSVDSSLLILVEAEVRNPLHVHNRHAQLTQGIKAVVESMSKGTHTVSTSFARLIHALARLPATSIKGAYAKLNDIEAYRNEHDSYVILTNCPPQLNDQDCVQGLCSSLLIESKDDEDPIPYSVQLELDLVEATTTWRDLYSRVKNKLDHKTLQKRTRTESGWVDALSEKVHTEGGDPMKSYIAQINTLSERLSAWSANGGRGAGRGRGQGRGRGGGRDGGRGGGRDGGRDGGRGGPGGRGNRTQPCWHWRDLGSCSRGDNCKFTHKPGDQHTGHDTRPGTPVP